MILLLRLKHHEVKVLVKDNTLQEILSIRSLAFISGRWVDKEEEPLFSFLVSESFSSFQQYRTGDSLDESSKGIQRIFVP